MIKVSVTSEKMKNDALFAEDKISENCTEPQFSQP